LLFLEGIANVLKEILVALHGDGVGCAKAFPGS
jgi:hypothetical protein